MTMEIGGLLHGVAISINATEAIISSLAAVHSNQALATLMEEITRELGFRYYAMIHHRDLRNACGRCVDLKDYPPSAIERIIDNADWRRDPVIRACAFAEHAFLWSQIAEIMDLDRRDRHSLELGVLEGLNEGITIPYAVLGQAMGSCTFAGTKQPARAQRVLGLAQMLGVFAFQAARRIVSPRSCPARLPRLHPRPRDCVVLAGRGQSNKEIARALALTPRTVDGYLTEARRLFDAHDRTELVVRAVLAGEVGLDELRRGQPE